MKFCFLKQLIRLLCISVLNVCCGDQIFISEPVVVSDFVGSEFYGYVDGVGDKTMFQPSFDTSGSGRSFLSLTANPDGSIYLLDGNKLNADFVALFIFKLDNRVVFKLTIEL